MFCGPVERRYVGGVRGDAVALVLEMLDAMAMANCTYDHTATEYLRADWYDRAHALKLEYEPPLSKKAKEERMPPPPGSLVDALQDRIHETNGPVICRVPFSTKSGEWVTKDGTIIDIQDLTDTHLLNIIGLRAASTWRFLSRKHQAPYDERDLEQNFRSYSEQNENLFLEKQKRKIEVSLTDLARPRIGKVGSAASTWEEIGEDPPDDFCYDDLPF